MILTGGRAALDRPACEGSSGLSNSIIFTEQETQEIFDMSKMEDIR